MVSGAWYKTGMNHVVPGAVLILSALLLASCPGHDYAGADMAESRRLGDLFELLGEGTTGDEERYAVVHKISTTMAEAGDWPLLVDFLSDTVASDPANRFNARYLLGIAWAYARQGADEVAALYYDRIVRNYPDLVVDGASVHLACLRELLVLVDDPARRLGYRRELIDRFPDAVDMGTELFLLGNDYESLGDWDAALEAYRRFLPAFSGEVPDHPDALQYARQFIDLATIRKDWTYETLDDLIDAVSQAMASGNSRTLSRIRAKVGFFAMDWYQDKEDGNSQVLFDFGAFMAGSRIHRADNLDPSSNAREAFLRTWGWSERISVWYLYFRKVDFPADPEVHGRWEWAGIYFGEKMQ